MNQFIDELEETLNILEEKNIIYWDDSNQYFSICNKLIRFNSFIINFVNNLLNLNFYILNLQNHNWFMFCKDIFGPIFINKKIIDKNIFNFDLKFNNSINKNWINMHKNTIFIQKYLINDYNQSLLHNVPIFDIYKKEYNPDEHIFILNKI